MSRLYLAPARPSVENLLHDAEIVATKKNVLVKVLLLFWVLFVQAKEIVLGFNLSFELQLLL